MRKSVPCLLAIAAFVVSAGTAEGVDVIAPLVPVPPPVGVLFQPTEQAVLVSVVDQREDKRLMGGGIMGPGFEKGSGLYIIYATETDVEIAKHFKSAAEDAIKTLGFKIGDGGLKLEIVIEDFWIDMYRMSAFSPMNCIAYGTLHTKLSAPDLPEPRGHNLRLTMWEDSVPAGSMKEVAKEAVSRQYAQSAWQAVATALLDERELRRDEEQLRRALELAGSSKEEVPARQAIFWLGITRQSGGPVKEKLLSILGQSKEQELHQAAAEALGLLGVQEAAPEMIAILGGKKAGGWDNTDVEQVWYLLHGLALLGDKDLRSKVSSAQRKELNAASKIEDLIAFHEGRKAPVVSEAAAEKLAKAKEKLAKKREK